MIQCNIFCSNIFAYNTIILIVILSLFLCYKTQSSSIIIVMASVDAFVPTCLSLALFFDQAHLNSLCSLRQFLFSLNWWESYFTRISGAGWHQISALSAMCGKSLLVETQNDFR